MLHRALIPSRRWSTSAASRPVDWMFPSGLLAARGPLSATSGYFAKDESVASATCVASARSSHGLHHLFGEASRSNHGRALRGENSDIRVSMACPSSCAPDLSVNCSSHPPAQNRCLKHRDSIPVTDALRNEPPATQPASVYRSHWRSCVEFGDNNAPKDAGSHRAIGIDIAPRGHADTISGLVSFSLRSGWLADFFRRRSPKGVSLR